MEYAEKKVLISQKDFDTLLNQGSSKRDAILDAPKVTSVKLKQLNDHFLKERTRKKNQKDLEWSRLTSRIEPILSPLYRASSPATAATAAQPVGTATDDNDEDNEMQIVDFLDDNLTPTIRNKGQRLYQILLDYPEEIRVTKKRIYVNGQPLAGNTLAIIKNLIAKSKNLSYNVKRLLSIIALDGNVKNLISNEEALNYIKQAEEPHLTSSPKGTPGRKKSPRKKSQAKSPAKTPVKSKKSPAKRKRKQELEEADDSSSMSEDLDDTIVEVKQEKQGSGKARKRGLKWLRMF